MFARIQKETVRANSPLEECRKVPYKPEKHSFSCLSPYNNPSVALGCTHTIFIKASGELTSKLITKIIDHPKI